MKEIDNNEWANPPPAGLVSFAVACFGFFATLTGKVEASASVLLGIWLLGGFIIQIIVALLDLKSGNIAGGNTFLFFSGFFMFVGGTGMITKFFFAMKGIPIDTRIDGWAWIVLTVVLILWTPSFFKGPLTLAIIIIITNLASPFITLIDLKILPHDFAFIPGYILLIAGIIAIYLSTALVINGTYGRTILPITREVKENRRIDDIRTEDRRTDNSEIEDDDFLEYVNFE